MSPSQDMKTGGTNSANSNSSPAPNSGTSGGNGGRSKRNRNRASRNKNRIKTNSNGNDSGFVKPGPKFAGTCKKDLCDVTITYSPDAAIMIRQLQVFLPKIREAAGKISGALGKSIKLQRAITLGELMASSLHGSVPTSSYTVKDEHGMDQIDADKKARCDKIQDRLDSKVADDYNKFTCDWERFYATIMGQLCPATKEELQRSDGWETVEANLDPGALLRLIQSTCLHGNDKDYYPERVLTAVRDLVLSKQGNNSPSEFAELTKTGLKTIHTLFKMPEGQTFWGQFYGMREHAINTSGKFDFDPADLELQSAEVNNMVHQSCEDIMIGCIMTVLSNRSKSDTYIEARKNQLAGNLGGYATDPTSAVNILVGNELMKRKESNPRSSYTNGGGNKSASNVDSSEALVLVGVAAPTEASGDSCWTCGATDHFRYECPSLSEQAKKEIMERYKKGRGNDDSKPDKIKAAVLMHVVDKEDSDSDSDNNQSFFDSDDSESGESDNVEDNSDAYNFSFCQVVGEEKPDDWENDSHTGSVNGEDLVEEVADNVDDSLIESSETAKLEHVLGAVAVEQSKPSTWLPAVKYKFGKIGIFTVAKLHELLPSLNQRLKIGGYSILHRTTLAGISAETSKSLEADFRRGQA